MIIYLGITLSKPLTKIPHPSSIELKIDGKEYLCTWDESDHCFDNTEHTKTDHRLKGVSVWEGGDTEEFYGNGLLKADSKIEFMEINFDEMNTEEEFEEKVSYLCVVDDDVKIVVIEENPISLEDDNEKSCDNCGRFNYATRSCGEYIDTCMNMEKKEAYSNWIPMCHCQKKLITD